MSIHGECFDNGMSGRCNMWDCEGFLEGDCSRPEDIFDISEVDSDEEEEEIFDMYPQLREIYLKKEIEMSKRKDALDTQREDRVAAANRLHKLALSLTKVDRPKDAVFFDGNEKEVFGKIVSVPVHIVCLENNGVRKTFVNAVDADPSVLKVLVSAPLIETFVDLETAVSEVDKGLGCENLDKMVAKALA